MLDAVETPQSHLHCHTLYLESSRMIYCNNDYLNQKEWSMHATANEKASILVNLWACQLLTQVKTSDATASKNNPNKSKMKSDSIIFIFNPHNIILEGHS